MVVSAHNAMQCHGRVMQTQKLMFLLSRIQSCQRLPLGEGQIKSFAMKLTRSWGEWPSDWQGHKVVANRLTMSQGHKVSRQQTDNVVSAIRLTMSQGRLPWDWQGHKAGCYKADKVTRQVAIRLTGHKACCDWTDKVTRQAATSLTMSQDRLPTDWHGHKVSCQQTYNVLRWVAIT